MKALRHYCRNLHCRSKLKAPVENEHRAFCCRGCHSSFYRSHCLVCREPMHRKTEQQRFKSGHAVCRAEYRRFPHVYARELPIPTKCTQVSTDATGQPAIVGAIVAGSVRREMDTKGGHDLLNVFLTATKGE
jgi:hypothetical protein